MANRERGEIGIEVEGKAYTLRPDFDAVCELEGLTNKAFEHVLMECAEGRMSGLRACVWCLLQRYHSDEIKALRDASDWIERAGGVARVYEAVQSVLKENEEPAVGGKANPRKARASGTGGRSSSRLVRSA
jgi:hypothetical protein